jgi:hypothetical protein
MEDHQSLIINHFSFLNRSDPDFHLVSCAWESTAITFLPGLRIGGSVRRSDEQPPDFNINVA